jgi:ribonuclease P protein component
MTWLTRTADLELVRREGKRLRTSLLEVRHLASLFASPRIGIIVPRYAHTAVDRNRVKRRLRAALRAAWANRANAPSHDVVFRAGPAAYRATFAELSADVHRTSESIAGRAR